MSPQTERLDPRDLDLDTADLLADIERAGYESAGLPLPADVGPTLMKSLQLTSDNRPVDSLWLAYDADRIVGYAVCELPWRDNTDSVFLRGQVHPDARRRGVGRALLAEALGLPEGASRSKVYSGAYHQTDGMVALETMGFTALGVNAIRRIDVHAASHGHWDRLHEEALAAAGDYELVRQVGSTPDERVAEMVALHDAINDAPLDDPDMEDDAWDADRVVSYETAMAGRRQTVYRVMARQRSTGQWAGQSMLCVDEFAPSIAFQEDTSVVRAHRGHRLGLLMKTEMLRWVSAERPEISATDTWNSTTNHHMIAVNEALGARVIGGFTTFRMDRG